MMVKCPGCEIEFDELNLGNQVWHMERCHLDIIEKRWKDGGLSPKEILTLKTDIDKRLPSWKDLCLACRDKGWDINYKFDKNGHSVILVNGKQVIVTDGISAVAALSLAMDIAIYRKWSWN